MPTVALEGTGARITFAWSGFSSDLISLTLPERVCAAIETTHLGTSGAKTYRPGRLRELGAIACTCDHDPQEALLVGMPVADVIVTYPLRPGQTTPDALVFRGFVEQQGGQEHRLDQRLLTTLSIRLVGATAASDPDPDPPPDPDPSDPLPGDADVYAVTGYVIV